MSSSESPAAARIQRIVELLAAGAIDRIWITDAYLVAPRSLFQSLLDAAGRGVDVRLLVPGASDLPIVRNLTRIGYRDLLRAGVRIFEWDGPMLHAKTIVADGAMVPGRARATSTLPAWSGTTSWTSSCTTVISAGSLEAQFRRDTARSAEVAIRLPGSPAR